MNSRPAVYQSKILECRTGQTSSLLFSKLAKLLCPTGPLAFFKSASHSANSAEKENNYHYAILGGKTHSPSSSPFQTLETLLASSSERPSNKEIEVSNKKKLPPFIGGIISYISYDSYRHLEKIPKLDELAKQNSEPKWQIPEGVFIQAEVVLCLNEDNGVLSLIDWQTQASPSKLKKQLEDALENLVEIKETTPAQNNNKNLQNPEEFIPAFFKQKYKQKEYENLVLKAKEFICAGDAFQTVLSNRFRRSKASNALQIYNNLLHSNPSPYHFYLKAPGFELVAASPEKFLTATKETKTLELSTRLVAGSYPITQNNKEDKQEISHKLGADPKEQAEHIMLVDHMRNDLGRVAETGSVQVKELLSKEIYQDVVHLVSQVNCKLQKDTALCRASESLFPMATLTGTPKIRAVEILAELEKETRGAFGGTFFCIAHDQSYLDSSVIIRTAIVHPHGSEIRAGGGVVYDSEPSREYKECFWKAASIARACILAEEGGLDDSTPR